MRAKYFFIKMFKKKSSFIRYIILYVKGLGVGAANSVPGVSGGTIALITGILEELLDSLRSLSPKNFKLLLTGQIKTFWVAINGNFLLFTGLGILTGLVALAKIVLNMLDIYPVATWSFFFGLILISTVSVLRTISKTTLYTFTAFFMGAIAAYLITFLSVAQTTNELWFIFICGATALCVMVMPGVSASFILLIMGKYQYMLTAVTELKIGILTVFGCGAIIGLLLFSHLMSWLLRKFYDITIALLAGFMFGALNKVWPWKVHINIDTEETWAWNMERFTDHSLNLIEKNHMPQTFEQLTGVEANLNVGLISAAAAIVIFVAIEAMVGFKKIGK